MKTSKRILIMMFIAIMVLLAEGCKKDDPAPTPAEMMVGSWKEVSYVRSGCTDAADNESSTCTASCETLVVSATTLTFGTEPPYPYTADGSALSVTVSGTIYIVTIAVTATTLTTTIQDSPADGNCKKVTNYTKL